MVGEYIQHYFYHIVYGVPAGRPLVLRNVKRNNGIRYRRLNRFCIIPKAFKTTLIRMTRLKSICDSIVILKKGASIQIKTNLDLQMPPHCQAVDAFEPFS